MKKIVILLGFALLCAIGFGQNPDRQITDSVPQYLYNAGTQPYKFVHDGNKYILSYEILKDKSDVQNRPMFLYCNTTKVSDAIQYDYYKWYNDEEYKSFYWTGFTKGASGQAVKELQSGNIVIFLVTYHSNASMVNEYATYKLVVLFSQGEQFVHVKYEPKNSNIRLAFVEYYCKSILEQINDLNIGKSKFDVILDNNIITFERTW